MQVTLGLLLARIYLASQNTLQNNGRWQSSKTEVSRSLMGAESFLRERQALAGGHLDVSAWHGYQEVVTKEAFALTTLTFDFKLQPGAWLTAILDRPDQEPFTAVRFGTTELLASASLRVRPSGEFLRRTRIKPRKLEPDVWHRAEVTYSEESAELALDGIKIGTFDLPARAERRIGFRGSGRSTLVDDIRIASNGRALLRESFGAPRYAARITAAIVGAVLVANALALGALSLLGRRRRRTVGFAYAMVSSTLVVIAALVLGFVYLKGKSYPFADELQEAETRTRNREIARIRAQVRRNHDTEPEAGVHRLLVMGASQTWGSGALKHRHVWVSVLERLLNDDPNLTERFECINAGVASARSFHLARVLEQEWLALGARTIVLNLSINDADLAVFEASVERIVELGAGSGARVVLVLEAWSPAFWGESLQKKHQIMRNVAAAHGVPIVDMHNYLEERRDDGLLWWDIAHLTSFGQQLLAEKLHLELQRLEIVR